MKTFGIGGSGNRWNIKIEFPENFTSDGDNYMRIMNSDREVFLISDLLSIDEVCYIVKLILENKKFIDQDIDKIIGKTYGE